MINYNLLLNCPVFKGLDETTIDKILKEIHYQVKHYSKNDIIAKAAIIIQLTTTVTLNLKFPKNQTHFA